jgi:hypothetical protein
MSKKTISQAPKNEDTKLEETRRPKNLLANAVPTDGYILSVDRKMKTRYESSDEAMTAARKLKQTYPLIQVAVYDAAQRIYTAVDTDELASSQSE